MMFPVMDVHALMSQSFIQALVLYVKRKTLKIMILSYWASTVCVLPP